MGIWQNADHWIYLLHPVSETSRLFITENVGTNILEDAEMGRLNTQSQQAARGFENDAESNSEGHEIQSKVAILF